MKFDRSLFVKTAETQVSEDGTLIVYVDEETLESTGRVLINSKTSSGGALFYADGTPQQWIPVTERLPEEFLDRRILVSTVSPTGRRSVDIGLWECGKWTTYFPIGDDRVTAWMPLPEPWKGGE